MLIGNLTCYVKINDSRRLRGDKRKNGIKRTQNCITLVPWDPARFREMFWNLVCSSWQQFASFQGRDRTGYTHLLLRGAVLWRQDAQCKRHQTRESVTSHKAAMTARERGGDGRRGSDGVRSNQTASKWWQNGVRDPHDNSGARMKTLWHQVPQ